MTTTTPPHQLKGLHRPDGKIRTFTGKYIDPFDPHPDEIDIEDIAHALTNACRFTGHTKRHYSIAQHSMMVMDSVPAEHKLCALLHDASEAYLCDIPTPVKKNLPGYAEAEGRLMVMIAKKYGFQWPVPAAVKSADRLALEWEWWNVVKNDNQEAWHPRSCKQLFLWRFQELTYKINS